MAQNETAYKGRVNVLFDRLKKNTGLKYWSTALGYGAVNGLMDKWFHLGTVPVFFEAKRKGKAARELQEARIKTFKDSGMIAFCLAARPKETGIKGNERLEFIETLLGFLDHAQCKARALQYVKDCAVLRKELKKMRKEING